MKEKRNYRYSISLADIDADIRELAEKENRTYSNMIQTLLKEAIAARKKFDNPNYLIQ